MSKKVHEDFLCLRQPAKGYRYGIDSLLLARFAKFFASDSVCDLGGGVGLLGLLALSRGKVKHVVAVEVQQELAKYSLENARRLGVDGRFEVLHANWKEAHRLLKPKRFHVVLSNPPYRKVLSGKIPPEKSKAIAKHEILGSLPDLVQAAAYLLKPSGRFYVMYPPLRMEELIAELKKNKLKTQRLAAIHPYADRPATLVMLEAVRGMNREMVFEPPVVVYRDPDHYTPEVEAWVGRKRKL